MERITDALERARREGAAASLAEMRPRPALERRSSVAESLGGIVYTQTRTLQPPTHALHENRVITAQDPRRLTSPYKMLRTQVLQRMRENGWNALAITSPGEREGKTLTSINLGISLAMEVEQTVLLVDADLSHPSVVPYFGLPPQPGLSDYLLSGTSLEDLLIYPGIGRFVLLPGGSPIPNSAEMLGSSKMAELVHEIKTRYPSRLVLFDLPPVLSAADVLAFSPYVDCVLLVVEEGRTGTDDVTRAAELLAGKNLIGSVLNKSRETAAEKRSGWLSNLFRRSGP